MLSNFYKTISECWWRTTGNKNAAHSLWKENKELSKYKRRINLLTTGPTPAWGREAGVQQSEPEDKGQSWPQRPASSTKLWVGCQLLIPSSWSPGRLTFARRVTAWDQLSRGDAGHTWYSALMAHPGNWVAWTQEVIKMHSALETVCSFSIWLAELLGHEEDTKRMCNWFYAFVVYLKTWTWEA